MSKPLREKEIYAICSLKQNTITLPDGNYRAYVKTVDYSNENWNDKGKTYYSNTNIVVRSGLIDLATILKATEEILLQNGYWGRFLEDYEFNDELNAINLFIGS